MNIAMIAFAFVLMIFITLFISRAITDLVLRPMQRMLSAVKEIAKPILGDVNTLGLESVDNDLDEAMYDDEIYVLEKIVEKLGKIAGIAARLTLGAEPTSMKGLSEASSR